MTVTTQVPQPQEDTQNDAGDLNDMLQELRILLQGVQVLTAFLIILPFSPGFAKIDQIEKWIYLATFICSIVGLVLFSAPAAQHRLERPLMDRVRFKLVATRMIVIGLVPSSLALVLVSHLVVAEVAGAITADILAGGVAILIALMWWLLPLAHKQQQRTEDDSNQETSKKPR